MKILPVLLLAAITALRLGAAAHLPVTPDEAFQWMSAQRLDWAFFDAPPGTAVLVRLGTLLLGDDPIGLRLAFPLLAALATLGAWLLGRALHGPAAGWWAAIALNALPGFNVAAVHADPALPAIAFTLAGAWALVRALDGNPRRGLAAGLFLAAAAQASYVAFAAVPGALAAEAFSRSRLAWRRPGVYLAVTLPLLALLPALTWNRAHGWPAAALGTWSTELTPQWHDIPGALAAAATAISLPAFLTGIAALILLGRRARLHARPRLVLCLAAPFILLVLRDLLHGTSGRTPLLLAASIVAAGAAGIFLETRRLRLTGAAALLSTAGFFAFAPAAKTDPWPQIAAALDSVLVAAQAGRPDPLFVIAPDPESTAALNYYLARSAAGAPPPVFLRESQDLSNQFGLWPRYDDFVPVEKAPDEFFQELKAENRYLGRSALYLGDEDPADLPQTITAAFGRVTPRSTLTLPGGRKLRVYLCEDYQTMPL